MKAPEKITQEITLKDGRVITLETGRMARQANGSVLLSCGGTSLLATVVASKEARPGVDFLPLSVEYKEKFAGAGRVPGGFLKREGRPSDREILVCRLVDRVLRPLFPDDFHADIQVIITMLSFDPAAAPESLAGFAASSAISISDIPFNGPMSEVSVARVNGEFIVNPNYEQLEEADMEMMIGGTTESVVMVEGEMKEVSEDEMLEAIQVGHDAIKEQVKVQKALAKLIPTSEPKREYSHEEHNDDLRKRVHEATYAGAYEAAGEGISDRKERSKRFKQVFEDFSDTMSEEEKEDGEEEDS